MPASDERKPAPGGCPVSPPVAATPAASAGHRGGVAARRRDAWRWCPTMGALHAGHLALVERGRARPSRTVVSIFVNPAQFVADRRPRPLSAHLRCRSGDAGRGRRGSRLRARGRRHVSGRLRHRRSHRAGRPWPASRMRRGRISSAGVATVVAKLLLQSLPDVAMFGEKDYQQLQVVRTRGAGPRHPGRDRRRWRRFAKPTGWRCRRATGSSARTSAVALPPFLSRFARRRTRSGAERRSTPRLRGGATPSSASAAALDYLEARNAETLMPAER